MRPPALRRSRRPIRRLRPLRRPRLWAPPQGYGPPPGYGASPGLRPATGLRRSPGYAAAGISPSGGIRRARPATNALAIASLVASVICCAVSARIAGIVLGVIALNQIKHTGEHGRGLAIAGIAVGAVTLVLSLLGPHRDGLIMTDGPGQPLPRRIPAAGALAAGLPDEPRPPHPAMAPGIRRRATRRVPAARLSGRPAISPTPADTPTAPTRTTRTGRRSRPAPTARRSRRSSPRWPA